MIIKNRYKLGIIVFMVIGLFSADFIFKEINNDDHKIVMTNTTMPELDCLAKNIHWEARGESLAGKIAVAQVTLNRVADGRFGNTICSVVHQKTKSSTKTVCQFSWVCETKNRIKKITPSDYRESMLIAKQVMFHDLKLNNLTDALYFHADYVNPRWKKERIVKIGNHIFYKETEGKK
jgi:spore germination cell wall hydrolase CwlJ-like protein